MKNPKRLAAVIALAAIVILIIAFVISAFMASPDESGGRFMALLYGIVAIPILAWLIMFCVGKIGKRQGSDEMFENGEK